LLLIEEAFNREKMAFFTKMGVSVPAIPADSDGVDDNANTEKDNS
jgi:hypothetical protein